MQKRRPFSSSMLWLQQPWHPRQNASSSVSWLKLTGQCRVHLHHRITAGEAEYLGMRPAYACQGEGVVLDALGHSVTLVVRVYDESAGGHIVLVAPCLYIAEACKLVAVERQHRLGFLHLGGHILVCALGDTCSALLGSFPDGLQNSIYILLVGGLCHHYPYVVLLVHFLHLLSGGLHARPALAFPIV